MVGRPSRGEPPKAPQIVDVALELFKLHGYRATTMDKIAEVAGMSKQTLYRHFANKQDLFVTVVQTVIERSPIRVSPPSGGAQGLRDMLVSFAEQLAAAYAREDAVRIFRMVISEAAEQPGLGQHFYTEITAVAARPLAHQLSVAHGRGMIDIDDPFDAAIRLIAVLKEYFLWPRLLGRTMTSSPTANRRLVEGVVDDFLNARRPAA